MSKSGNKKVEPPKPKEPTYQERIIKEYQDQVQEQLQTICKLQLNLQEYIKNYNFTEESNKKLDKHLTDALAQITQMQSTIIGKDHSYDILKTQFDSKCAQFTQLQDQYSIMDKTQQLKESTLKEEMQLQIQQLQNEKQHNIDVCQQLKQKIQQVEQQNYNNQTTQQQENNKAIESHVTQLSNYRLQVNNLESKVNELTNVNKSLDIGQKQQITQQENQIISLRNELRKVKRERDNYKQSMNQIDMVSRVNSPHVSQKEEEDNENYTQNTNTQMNEQNNIMEHLSDLKNAKSNYDRLLTDHIQLKNAQEVQQRKFKEQIQEKTQINALLLAERNGFENKILHLQQQLDTLQQKYDLLSNQETSQTINSQQQIVIKLQDELKFAKIDAEVVSRKNQQIIEQQNNQIEQLALKLQDSLNVQKKPVTEQLEKSNQLLTQQLMNMQMQLNLYKKKVEAQEDEEEATQQVMRERLELQQVNTQSYSKPKPKVFNLNKQNENKSSSPYLPKNTKHFQPLNYDLMEQTQLDTQIQQIQLKKQQYLKQIPNKLSRNTVRTQINDYRAVQMQIIQSEMENSIALQNNEIMQKIQKEAIKELETESIK